MSFMETFLNNFVAGVYGGVGIVNGETYEERKVDRTTINGYMVDTVKSGDIGKLYETGIIDDKQELEWVIVEDYDTIEEAQEGHNKWVKKVKRKNFNFNRLKDIYEGE